MFRLYKISGGVVLLLFIKYIAASKESLEGKITYFPNLWPGPRFAPYFDVELGNGLTLSQIAEKTGQLDYTLEYIVGSSAGCVPTWRAEKDLNDSKILDEIEKVQSKGGQMIASIGGGIGPYLEDLCTSVDDLANAYKKVMDVVRTNHLELDIEAPNNIDMVTKALAKVQAERPLATVSFTLIVQARDIVRKPDLSQLLESAKANGVKIKIVNVMPLEFDGSSDSLIGTAKAVLKQMKQIWSDASNAELKKMLGITPMIGLNFNRKQFLPQHARKLVDWAKMNQIGFLSFWSIGRDNGDCADTLKSNCSGIDQTEYEFTKIFQRFKG